MVGVGTGCMHWNMFKRYVTLLIYYAFFHKKCHCHHFLYRWNNDDNTPSFSDYGFEIFGVPRKVFRKSLYEYYATFSKWPPAAILQWEISSLSLNMFLQHLLPLLIWNHTLIPCIAVPLRSIPVVKRHFKGAVHNSGKTGHFTQRK